MTQLPGMRRTLRSLLVTAALLAACGGGGDSGTSNTTAVPRSTTTTGADDSTTTTTEAVTPEEEARRAAVNLLEIRNDVFQAPDLSRIAEYATASSNLAENDASQLGMAIDDAAHWDGPPLELLGVRVTDFEDVLAPRLVVIAEGPARSVVRSDGSVVASFEPRAPFAISLALLTDGGRTRVSDFLVLNDFDPALLDDIVRAGLP